MRRFAVVAFLASASCASFSYEATDGQRTHGSWLYVGGESAKETVVRSARHDIPCDDVSALDDVDPGTHLEVHVAEGCGQRVTYAFVPDRDDSHRFRCTLISRLSLDGR